MPSRLLPSRSSVGINNTPFVDTLHSKPGAASPPLQYSAGTDASRWIAGLLSKPRSASACNRSVEPHWHMPYWLGVIDNLLQSQPTPPLTPSFSLTLLGIVASLCHDRGKHGIKLVPVTAGVGGFGLALWKRQRGAAVYAPLFLGN